MTDPDIIDAEFKVKIDNRFVHPDQEPSLKAAEKINLRAIRWHDWPIIGLCVLIGWLPEIAMWALYLPLMSIIRPFSDWLIQLVKTGLLSLIS